MAKIVFVAMNLLALGLGVWKVNAMGLLPYVHLSSKVPEGFAKFACTGQLGQTGLHGNHRGNRQNVRTRTYNNEWLPFGTQMQAIRCP